MKIFRTIKALRKYLGSLKNKSVGFVPTMGALHEGHGVLIKRSARENDITVVSIFVNPTQFGPKEDYKKYPRQQKKDFLYASKYGADAVFVPAVCEMYPDNFHTYVNVQELDKYLCGASRPGHFRGVATVVAKLLNIVGAKNAYFGKKDFQQVAVIKRMVRDLNIPVNIVACPTVRAKDGLALSSRNAYLSNEERKAAPLIYCALKKIAFMIEYRHFRSTQKAFKEFIGYIRNIPGSRLGYFQIVDAEELKPVKILKGKLLIACAVRVGSTRLIDNIEVSI